MLFSKRIVALLRHNRHTKLGRVKHHITVIRKKSAIIRQGNIAAYLLFTVTNADRVSNGNIIIICIHAVYSDLSLTLWHTSLHHADKIDLLPLCKHADRSVTLPIIIRIDSFFLIEILVYFDIFLFQFALQRC